MPCRDYQADEEMREAAGARLDGYAKDLCKAMKIIENGGLLKRASPRLRNWWTAHKEDDRREQEREAKKIRDAREKRDLVAKLSIRERRLLGL
jgi:hypothetical protein